MTATDRLDNLLPEITGWRRDIHRHPELQYELPRTAAFVADKLREFGCDEVVEGIGRSGVVALVHGRTRGSERVVGLRADMDALPITEATGAEWASTTSSGACTPAVTTGTRRCCSARRARSPTRATSTAPSR